MSPTCDRSASGSGTSLTIPESHPSRRKRPYAASLGVDTLAAVALSEWAQLLTRTCWSMCGRTRSPKGLPQARLPPRKQCVTSLRRRCEKGRGGRRLGGVGWIVDCEMGWIASGSLGWEGLVSLWPRWSGGGSCRAWSFAQNSRSRVTKGCTVRVDGGTLPISSAIKQRCSNSRTSHILAAHPTAVAGLEWPRHSRMRQEPTR
mmetsp:Transcript_47954/g.108056  ORF Transcript_47954/g.108056 Transcript_47954/m.108056 type:complete len:203 (+) Transcript_47954:302-910(+)